MGKNNSSCTRAGLEGPRMSFAPSGLNATCTEQGKDVCFLVDKGASHSVLHQEVLPTDDFCNNSRSDPQENSLPIK